MNSLNHFSLHTCNIIELFLLRPVNQSGFLCQHEQESMKQCHCHNLQQSLPQMCNKCKYKKWGVIFGYISEYKYGLVCDYIFHKAWRALWHLIMWPTRIFYLDIHPNMVSYFLRMWHYGALSPALPFTFRCLKWAYPWIHGDVGVK